MHEKKNEKQSKDTIKKKTQKNHIQFEIKTEKVQNARI